MPAVPAEVVVGAITILLTICIIVFVIVGHQVIQGEAIVGYDEVDALIGLPAGMLPLSVYLCSAEFLRRLMLCSCLRRPCNTGAEPCVYLMKD